MYPTKIIPKNKNKCCMPIIFRYRDNLFFFVSSVVARGLNLKKWKEKENHLSLGGSDV